MRYYTPKAAAIYYHHKFQHSTCVGVITELPVGFSIRVFDPTFIKVLLGYDPTLDLKRNAVVYVDSIPKPILLSNELLGDYISSVLNNTNMGNKIESELEKIAVVQQLIGRVIPSSFTITPLINTIQNKSHATYDFILTVPYRDNKIQQPLTEVISLLQKETTLHIRDNFLTGKESYVVTDFRDRVVGYLPFHIEDFCRVQYRNQRPPTLTITKVLGISETNNTPPYLVVEVRGDFFINSLGNSTMDNIPITIVPTRDTATKPTKKIVSHLDGSRDIRRRLESQVKFVIMACMNEKNAIGKNNTLPWHIPEDLQLFKKITSGELLIVGRKTFESLPINMPRRSFIVVSGRNDKAIKPRGDITIVVSNIEEAIMTAKSRAVEMGKKKVYVIGGANVYEQMLPYTHTAIITRCKNPCEKPDVFFPALPDNFIQQYEPALLARNEHGPVEVFYYQNTAISSF